MKSFTNKFAVLPCVLLALSCGGETAPLEVDPSDFTLPPVLLWCNGWEPYPPFAKFGLFDVGFHNAHRSSEFHPTEHQRAAIRAAGGTVIHDFNAPLVRAILPVDHIRTIPYMFVRSVPDANVFSVDATIGIDTPLTDDDRAFLESLGAEIRKEYTFDMVLLTIPDHSIPTLANRVSFFGLEPGGCVSPAN